MARGRLAAVRRRLGATLFVGATSVCCAEVLQLMHVQRAFDFEQFLLEPHMTILATAATFGFAVRAYQREAAATLGNLLEIVLVSSSKAKADTPKAVSADPPIDATAKNGAKESAKADDAKNRDTLNYVDAKFPWFVEAGIFASIVVMAVLLTNPQLLQNLTSLKAGSLEAHFASATGTVTVQSGLVVSVDLSRKVTTRGWATFRFPGALDDPRTFTYAESNKEDIAKSAEFFDRYVGPLFVYILYFDKKNDAIPYDAQQALRRIASQYATMILSHSGSLEVNEYPQFLQKPHCIQIPAVVSASQTQDCHDEFGRRLSEISVPEKWDAYIIQAIGDLLFVVWDRRHQEDFLVAAAGDDTNESSLACPKECTTAGQLSLIYDLVVAKVRSDRPWPFESMLSDLKKALQGIDAVSAKNDFDWGQKDAKIHDEVERLFRRNRLIDITIGLELFYQRAFQGQRFSSEQLQTWRAWTTEARSVIDLVEDDNVGWPPPFDESTLKSWRRAKEDIRSLPSLVQDALLGTAMSVTLIDASNGGIAPRDCLLARSLLERAKSNIRNNATYAALSPDDKGTYRGFLDQARTSIENRCQP